MGSFANSLFRILLGWLQTVVYMVWGAVNTSGGSFLQWIGNHWILLAVLLCLLGASADLVIYLFRWQPHKVWASFFRRIGGRGAADADTSADEEANTGHQASSFAYAEDEEVPIPDEYETSALMNHRHIENEILQTADSPTEKHSVTTPAGYTVPLDSPYRRPREGRSGYENDEEMSPNDRPQIMTTGRRRRRASLLFGDDERDAGHFEAPQDIINQHDAYRKPVYPTEWGHNGEE